MKKVSRRNGAHARKNMVFRSSATSSHRANAAPSNFADPEKAEEAIRHSIDENIEREAVIDRRALEAKALQHGMGRHRDRSSIREESRASRAERPADRRPANSVNSPRGAYTTPEMVALERENIEMMLAGQKRAAAIGTLKESPSDGAASGNCFQIRLLSPRLTLVSTDWLTSIEGRAGAAKTTTVGCDPRVRGRAGIRRIWVCADNPRGQIAFRSRRLLENCSQPPRRKITGPAVEADLDY